MKLLFRLWIPTAVVVASEQWALWYHEDFSTFTDDSSVPWELDDGPPFDTIMDDEGDWYRNDYGGAFDQQLDTFATYRKEIPLGTNGWLTASMSARDWNNDGIVEHAPVLSRQQLPDGTFVAEIDTSQDHTGGIIVRNTQPLPESYRIEYTLKTIDFGGKRNGELSYNNRRNGYLTDTCKTQHPWGPTSRNGSWSGNASLPYCEWPSASDSAFGGYNGFYYLAICDVKDAAPRNNHFWHLRRKVQMEMFAYEPQSPGGGAICNSADKTYSDYSDSSYNVVNMWMSGLPSWKRGDGQLTSTAGYFMTTCSDGVAERGLKTAAELQPELMPNISYKFAIERNATGYTLEASGEFKNVGQTTLRFHRPFIVDDVPIWHYNTVPGEYDGRYNNDLEQSADYGSTIWEDMWPADSVYPDYFVIGDAYTNVYEGKASLTDIRLYGPADQNPNLSTSAPTSATPTTPVPTSAASTSAAPSTALPTEPPEMETEQPTISSAVFDTTTDPTTTPAETAPAPTVSIEETFPPTEATDESPTESPLKQPNPVAGKLGDCEFDCDTDNDCADELMCSDAHKAELRARGLNPRKAACGDRVGAPKLEVCFDPASTGIAACDPQVDCDRDSDCAVGLLCADSHKKELKANNLDPRLANCDISVVNKSWEVCFDPAVVGR